MSNLIPYTGVQIVWEFVNEDQHRTNKVKQKEKELKNRNVNWDFKGRGKRDNQETRKEVN